MSQNFKYFSEIRIGQSSVELFRGQTGPQLYFHFYKIFPSKTDSKPLMLLEIGRVVHGIQLQFLSFFLPFSIFLLFPYYFCFLRSKRKVFNKKVRKKTKRKKFSFFFLVFLSVIIFLCSALKFFSLASEITFIIFISFYFFSLNKKTEGNKRR